MSDHNERACQVCGSLLHHEEDCPSRTLAAASCRICGCVDEDCSWCIALTGQPCSWKEADLCSACFVEEGLPDSERARLRARWALHKAKGRRGFAPVSRPLRQHGYAVMRVCKRIERQEKRVTS